MAAADDDGIHFKQLERDVYTAIDSDARYWRENDAKIRAITQVSSYDEFREFVKAAHLKPLQKEDKINRSRKIWNPLASGNSRGTVPKQSCLQAPVHHDLTDIKIPTTGYEFEKTWHFLETNEERYGYLRKIRGDIIPSLFPTEISFNLLNEILVAMMEFGDTVEDFCLVVEILTGITSTKRFGLTLQFLPDEGKVVCKQLFQKLWSSMADKQQDLVDSGITELTLNNLMRIYEIE